MNRIFRALAITASLAFALLLPPALRTHCDTMAGPVIADARIALGNGDVTPVLKWVKAEHEAGIRAAFQKTLEVRRQSPEARELADQYFFETLVRLHRAGEGAPYTGLKPAEAVEPIILETDKALDGGASEPLVRMLQEDVAAGVRSRFARAVEAKKHANDSVQAGREYVEAYVELTHYVEALHATAGGKTPHHAEPSEAHQP